MKTPWQKSLRLAARLPRVATCASELVRAARIHAPRGSEVLLYFSEVMWDEVWQRPQEFARRLCQNLPTIYISPVQLHRWLDSLGERWQPWRTVSNNDDHLTVLSPLTLPGHYRLAPIFQINCRLITALLEQWLAHVQRVYCITDSPFAWPVLRKLFLGGKKRGPALERLHFDVIDDFPSFGWAPPWARECETELLRHADIVTTGTYELWDQHRRERSDVEFVPCGVDFAAFNEPAGPIPGDLATCPEPRLGYIGSVSDRLDFPLLEQLADNFSHGSIVLVGPIRMSEALLPRRPNIYYLGLKSHAELPRYVQHFTVGLIPFLINNATVKLNPVKTLEYLAAGIPVVSTALPDVMRFFSHAVYVAKDRREFVQCVKEAVDSGDIERIRNGVELARTSSWDHTARRFLSRLLAPPQEFRDPPTSAHGRPLR